jgi:hypothetical protein
VRKSAAETLARLKTVRKPIVDAVSTEAAFQATTTEANPSRDFNKRPVRFRVAIHPVLVGLGGYGGSSGHLAAAHQKPAAPLPTSVSPASVRAG